jgi:hypothetical protein
MHLLALLDYGVNCFVDSVYRSFYGKYTNLWH